MQILHFNQYQFKGISEFGFPVTSQLPGVKNSEVNQLFHLPRYQRHVEIFDIQEFKLPDK